MVKAMFFVYFVSLTLMPSARIGVVKIAISQVILSNGQSASPPPGRLSRSLLVGKLRQIGTWKRLGFTNDIWAHFAAEIHLSELFEC